MTFKILQGDNRDTLKTLADNSVDAIVTDPPYGIDFLGKAWDANTGALETYQECLRVLKPGGHILAFSAARTYHHLAVTLEQAGFEIRDQIMWIYSSGFPKSQDVGKSIERTNKKKNRNDDSQGWLGWGTALKPAHEPIALARKPLGNNSIARNCQQWGTGALNIDATRVPYAENDSYEPGQVTNYAKKVIIEQANSEVLGKDAHEENTGWVAPELGRFPSNVLGEILQADYQKYFYCPKVSRRERHTGFELPPPMFGGVQGCYDENGERFAVGLDSRGIATEASMLKDMGGYYIDEQGNETKVNGKNIWLPQTGNIYIHGLKEEYRKWCEANNKTPNTGNNHPTVKPVALMEYLIKLVTPKGGTVLDPFNGSGSTGMAAVGLGYNYIGCELDPAYVEISLKRIEAWVNKEAATNNYSDLFQE